MATSKDHKPRIVALGGSFEHPHKGHRRLISKALQVGDKVVIGLTSDRFVKTVRKHHSVSGYQQRLSNLKSYLSRIGALKKTEIISLDDQHGPATSNGSITAIVVSPETLSTALEINQIRIKKKMNPLQIYVVDYVLAQNGKPISTSRISQGLIDEEGRL